MGILSLVVSIALYGNTLPGEFLFDDFQFVHNPLFFRLGFLPHLLFRPGTTWAPISGYRPLSYMSMNLQLALVGEHPFTFHVVNLLLNAAVILLIFLVTKRLFQRTRLAVITALLYAFFPIHTENVAYIKSRDDLLSVLLALWAWLLLLEGKRWRSALVFLLAPMAKELVFFLPILYFFVPKSVSAERTGTTLPKQKQAVRFQTVKSVTRDFFHHLFLAYPTMVALCTYAGFRLMTFGIYAFSGNAVAQIFNPLGFAPAITKFWTNWKITGMYIAKTFVPYNLSSGYQYNHLKLISDPFTSWEAWLGMFCIILFFIFAVHPKTRKTPLGVGALAFAVFFIPIPKVLFQGADIFAERWMYGPSVGLAMIGAHLFDRIIDRGPLRFFGWSLFTGVLIIYAAIILPRNLVWRNQRAAFTHMTIDAPGNMYAWYVLARDYYGDGDLETARRLADRAYAIDPAFPHPELRYLRGQIAFHQGNFPLAKEYLKDATELVDHATQVHGMYALILAKEGDPAAAIDYLEKKKGQYDETDPWIKVILGGSYYQIGDIESAKQYLEWDHQKGDFRYRSVLDNFLKSPTAALDPTADNGNTSLKP